MTEHEKNGVLSLLEDLSYLIGNGLYYHQSVGNSYEESLNVAIEAVEQKYGLSLEDE